MIDLTLAFQWCMLITATSDAIALRSAHSAPLTVVPRLLTESGLVKSTATALLNRLQKETSSGNGEQMFVQLVKGSRSDAKWNSKKSALCGVLYRRISAYSVLFGFKLERDSFPLLGWLLEESRDEVNPRVKKAVKKSQSDQKTAQELASSLFSPLESEKRIEESRAALLPKSDIEELSFERNGPKRQVIPDVYGGFQSQWLEQSNSPAIERWLESMFEGLTRGKSPETTVFNDIATALLDIADSETKSHLLESLEATLLRYWPRLSAHGNGRTFEKLFRVHKSNEWNAFKRRLAAKCLNSWSAAQLQQLVEWILDEDRSDGYDFESLVVALLSLSSVITPHARTLLEDTVSQSTLISDSAVPRAIEMVVKGLISESGDNTTRKDACYSLALKLSRRGKPHFRQICSVVLRQAVSMKEQNSPNGRVLDELYLQLYLYFPNWMDLGSASARSVLLRATEDNVSSWVNWISTTDDLIDDAISVFQTGDSRATKTLSDIGRKQPLLILRKLRTFYSILYTNATYGQCDVNQRGVIRGRDLDAPREIKRRGKKVKVSVVHWGYTFFEPLWICVLDILGTVHHEVLFTCGLKTGVPELLELYLLLVSTQIQLISATQITKLKAKMEEVFAAFRKLNGPGWKAWLGNKVGETEVRHLLILGSFISPQEAIESLR